MEQFIIKRTGLMPLRFDGDSIGFQSGKTYGGKEQERWHAIEIYATKGGKYVVHVEHFSNVTGEVSQSFAEVCENESNVGEWLQEHDPTAGFNLTSNSGCDVDRRAEAGNAPTGLTDRFAYLLGEVLAQAKIAEDVE